ncbi:tetratricopeptide repeat protein [Flavobacterium jejuense]|uniref:Tetratricopeptide repeat protein n=1 Tax=Flavobacterium jejuense TaxID=1544455 RepID=A0ABX0IQQ0_9FLAO|nr:S41 family peptidase [Flavobacterium jejuense]NHN26132.1 tetratricopeptide repeat protein [Flavobacterium jejuense]
MKKQIMTLVLVFFLLASLTAQNEKITKDEKGEIVAMISKNLLENYIDLAVAKEMTLAITLNTKSNKYDAITNPDVFSKIITEDLQKISNDLHLKLNYEPHKIAQNSQVMSEELKIKRKELMEMKMAEINYGFTEVKVLHGNIGYLNLRMFADIDYAKEAATAAMNFLYNTNAIIIDLRKNSGGVPSMMQLLSSYFTEAAPILLSNFYERKTNETTQLVAFESVDGKRMKNKPLYILTSKNTFSAAEAFTYTLKHLDKAVVVGEVTKGGANRTKTINLNRNFSISVPYIKAIHPVTLSNWEGKGVQPDIETNENEAFVVAYIDAINKTVTRKRNHVLNTIGYEFLQKKSIDEAIIVFKENAKLFPEEVNSWDSLGEAYFHLRDKGNALKAYQKALELDPNLESAKKMIQKLENFQ